MSVVYRFIDIAKCLSKYADFDPHLHSVPPLGMTPVETNLDLSCQKTINFLCYDVLFGVVRVTLQGHSPTASIALSTTRFFGRTVCNS